MKARNIAVTNQTQVVKAALSFAIEKEDLLQVNGRLLVATSNAEPYEETILIAHSPSVEIDVDVNADLSAMTTVAPSAIINGDSAADDGIVSAVNFTNTASAIMPFTSEPANTGDQTIRVNL